MFKRKKFISIDFKSVLNETNDIKIEKQGIQFTIDIKVTDDDLHKYVWFIHAYIESLKKYKLISYGIKKYSTSVEAQNEAMIYIQEMSKDQYEWIKKV